MAEVFEPTHQLVVLARLSEFCRWRGALLHGDDEPWDFMRRKLLETEKPLELFKGQLLSRVAAEILENLGRGPLDLKSCVDYKDRLERLLSRGDFADVAIHLSPDASPGERPLLEQALKAAKPHHLFIEERRPAAQRNPAWTKLVEELTQRLDLDRLSKVMTRRKKEPVKRKNYVLRRLRRNVAEYCTVVRIPTQPSDSVTPFMLPRIEAVIAANLRFLTRYR